MVCQVLVHHETTTFVSLFLNINLWNIFGILLDCFHLIYEIIKKNWSPQYKYLDSLIVFIAVVVFFQGYERKKKTKLRAQFQMRGAKKTSCNFVCFVFKRKKIIFLIFKKTYNVLIKFELLRVSLYFRMRFKNKNIESALE